MSINNQRIAIGQSDTHLDRLLVSCHMNPSAVIRFSCKIALDKEIEGRTFSL